MHNPLESGKSLLADQQPYSGGFMRRTLLLLSVLASGCASTSSPTANFDALLSRGTATTSAERQQAVDSDYKAAIAVCETKMQSLQDSVTGASKTQMSLAIVGVIAGSIVVPALAAKAVVAKSTIAAWGGVSGAANAGQYILQENGSSGSARALVYESLRKEIRTASAAYSAASASDGKAKAVNDLSMTCKFPPLPTMAPPANPGSTP
jgi:hypothetical protein